MTKKLSIDPEPIDQAPPSSDKRSEQGRARDGAPRSQQSLPALVGTLEWDASYDFKAERSRE